MRKALLIALPLLAASPIIGHAAMQQANSDAPQVPGAVDLSRVEAGTYATDPAHTLVGWRVSHFGFNDFFGIFGNVTGTLEIDPANPEAAQVDITIPVSEVTTTSEGLTAHLLRAANGGGEPDFFGPDPDDARFVSTSVDVEGQTATITGDFTLNGVTRPVTIDARFTGAGDHPRSGTPTIGFEGTATINRSDYGVSYGIPLVSDAVELDISVAFEKQSDD